MKFYLDRVRDVENRKLCPFIYITTKRKINFKRVFYITTPLPETFCQVCREKKDLTDHHIVPRRLRCANEFLREVRLKVCKDCHSKLHPENHLIMFLKNLVRLIQKITLRAKHPLFDTEEFKDMNDQLIKQFGIDMKNPINKEKSDLEQK